jgi:hypothetical protein
MGVMGSGETWGCEPGFIQVGELDCLEPRPEPQSTGPAGAPACFNGIQDNGEDSVDCGGSSDCDPCVVCKDPNCANPTALSSDQSAVLSFINGKRAAIMTGSLDTQMPKPAYLANMVWDDELAKIATWHASSCSTNLIAQNQLPDEPPLAQTMFMSTNADADIGTALTSWWNKINTFNFQNGACTGDCQGFLQMAGSTTTRVGCAINNRCSVTQGPYTYKSSIVCTWTRPYSVVNGLYPPYQGGEPYWDTLPKCNPPPPVAPPICNAPNAWENWAPSSILPWDQHPCNGMTPGNECLKWDCAPGYEKHGKLICRQRGQDPNADPTNPVPPCFNGVKDEGEERIDCGGSCALDCIICDNGNCVPNGVPPTAQTSILNEINNRRLSFFMNPPPGAQRPSFMPSVIWDDEFAQFAQYHVNTCSMQLTSPEEEPGPMGQTIFFSTRDTTAITKAIEIWWNKINDYDFTTDTCNAANQDCHGFQQMAWTKTVKVGCAINKSCNQQSGEFLYKTFIACHWGPPFDGTQPIVDEAVQDEEWILPQCLPVKCDAPKGFAHVVPSTLPTCAGTDIDGECLECPGGSGKCFECEPGYEPTMKMICLGPEELIEDGSQRVIDPPACFNGVKDSDETGVDCGGSCSFLCVTCNENCRPNGVSMTGQSAALTVINRHRQDMMTNPPAGLDPPPAFMPNMVWDTDIANFAQWHVQRCDMAMVDATDAPAPLGQTVFFATSPTVTLQDALEKWWSKIDCYDFVTNTCNMDCAGPGGCDGFLQMAWSKTTKFGCAVNQNCNANGQAPDGSPVTYKSYVACHWGPPYDPKDVLVVQETSAEWTDPVCMPKKEYCEQPPAEIPNADNDSTGNCVPTEFGVPCNKWRCNTGYVPIGELICIGEEGEHAAPPPPCFNGVQDQKETGVDCGGECGIPCVVCEDPFCAENTSDGSAVASVVNDYRQTFFTQPPEGHKPAYMPMVVWDEEMAKFAQWHANTCSMATVNHDLMPSALGNTVFFSTKDTTTMENVMDKWWGKLDCYDWDTKTCNTNSAECQGSCDGFLQMAWSKTTKFGCALNHACTFPKNGQIYKTFVSCMWGPPFDNSELFPPAPPPDIWQYPVCEPLLCEDPPDAVDNSNSPIATGVCAGHWAGEKCDEFACFPSFTQVGDMICRGRPAMPGEEMPPPCMNGHQDEHESGLDCGGDECAPCINCSGDTCRPNQMAESDQTQVLNAINSKRQGLILGTDAAKPDNMPPPAYMPNIVWDDEMAEYAQWLAEQCRDKGSPFLTIEEMGGTEMGQNVYIGGVRSWPDVVDIWWKQIECYDYETNTCSDDCPNCDNFKQLASAATTRMGCAVNTDCKSENGYASTMTCLFGLPFNHNAPPFKPPSMSEWQLPQCRSPAYIYHYGFDSSVADPPPPIIPPKLVTVENIHNMTIQNLLYTYQHTQNQEIRNQILQQTVTTSSGNQVSTSNVIKNYQKYVGEFSNGNAPTPRMVNNAAQYGLTDNSVIITKTGAHTVEYIRNHQHEAGYGFAQAASVPQIAANYRAYGYAKGEQINVGGNMGTASVEYILSHINKFDGQAYQKAPVSFQQGIPPVRIAPMPIPVPPPPPPVHLFRPAAAPAPAFLAYGEEVNNIKTEYKEYVGANIQTVNMGSVTAPYAIANAEKIQVQTTTGEVVTLKQAQEQNLQISYRATTPPPPPFSQNIVKIAQQAPAYGYGINSVIQTEKGEVTVQQVLNNPEAYRNVQVTYTQKQENRVYQGNATRAPAPVIALNPPVYNIQIGQAIPLKAVNGVPRAAQPAPVLITQKYELGYGVGGRPVPVAGVGQVPIPKIIQNTQNYETVVVQGVNQVTKQPFSAPAPQVATHTYQFGYDRSTIPAPIPVSGGSIPYPKLTDVETRKNYETVMVTGTKQTPQGLMPFAAPAPRVASQAVTYGFNVGGTKQIPTSSGRTLDVTKVIENTKKYENQVVNGVRTVENQPFNQPVPVVASNYRNYGYWKQQNNVEITNQATGEKKTVSMVNLTQNSANYQDWNIINRAGVPMKVPFRAPVPMVAVAPQFGYSNENSKSYEFRNAISNTGFKGYNLGSTTVKTAPVPDVATNPPAYGYNFDSGGTKIVLPGKGLVDISTIQKNYANYNYGLTGVSPAGTPFRALVSQIAANGPAYGYGASGSIKTSTGEISISKVLANMSNYEYTTSVTNLQGQTVEVPVPTVATNAPNYGYGTGGAISTPAGRVPVPAINNDLDAYSGVAIDAVVDGKYDSRTGTGNGGELSGLSGRAGEAAENCKKGYSSDCQYLAEQVGAAMAFGGDSGFDKEAQLEMADGGSAGGLELEAALASSMTGQLCSGVTAAVCDPSTWGSRFTGISCSGVSDPSVAGAVTCGTTCDFTCDQGLMDMNLVKPVGGTRGKCFPDGQMYFWKPSQSADGESGDSWTGEETKDKPMCDLEDTYGLDDCYKGIDCTEFMATLGAGTATTAAEADEFRGGAEGVTIQGWAEDGSSVKGTDAAYQFGAQKYVDPVVAEALFAKVASNPDKCNENSTCATPNEVPNANVTCVSATDDASVVSEEDKAKAVCNQICTWVCAPGLVHAGPNKAKCMPDNKLFYYSDVDGYYKSYTQEDLACVVPPEEPSLETWAIVLIILLALCCCSLLLCSLAICLYRFCMTRVYEDQSLIGFAERKDTGYRDAGDAKDEMEYDEEGFDDEDL